MRSQEEFDRMYEALDNLSESLDWRGDNFKYGMYVGKLSALEWLKGDVSSGELSIHYDYNDYLREQKLEFQDMREGFKELDQRDNEGEDQAE